MEVVGKRVRREWCVALSGDLVDVYGESGVWLYQGTYGGTVRFRKRRVRIFASPSPSSRPAGRQKYEPVLRWLYHDRPAKQTREQSTQRTQWHAHKVVLMLRIEKALMQHKLCIAPGSIVHEDLFA